MPDYPQKSPAVVRNMRLYLYAPTVSALVIFLTVSAQQSAPAQAPKSSIPVHYLDDQTYAKFIKARPGMVLVEFYKDAPSCSDGELLIHLGVQTNHFTVARVNLATNMQLAARLEAGTLENIERGTTMNGKPIIVRRLPCLMTMLHSKRIDCLPEDGSCKDSWHLMERRLVEWLWAEVTYRERRYSMSKFDKPRPLHPRGPEHANFGEEDEPAIFQIALEQDHAFTRHNHQNVSTSAASALAYLADKDSGAKVPPALITMLDNPQRAGFAAHSLAAFKANAAPALDKLIQLAGQIQTVPSVDHKPSPANWSFANGVAALQTIGSIGPKAVRAAPTLKEFAGRQYASFVKTRGRLQEFSGLHSAGLVAAIALNAVNPEPATDGSRQTAHVTGTTWHLSSGTLSDQKLLPRVTVYFWRGHTYISKTSDADGKLDLHLEPGIYACGWTTEGGGIFRRELLTPELRELLLFEFKAGENPPVEIPARVTIYD